MKRFIETLKNIWKIEDLRSRILYTLGIILIYRLGTHVVLPGIDPVIISDMANSRQQGGAGILDLLNLFTGGAFARASIFGLGIMPYISASIVVQLLGIAVPYFQKLQREGESGRRKINQITRYLTVAILIPQGLSYITSLRYQLPAEAFSPTFSRLCVPGKAIARASGSCTRSQTSSRGPSKVYSPSRFTVLPPYPSVIRTAGWG